MRDGVLRRMIDKWLGAGVQEDGSLEFPEDGTPQGGVVSPLLVLLCRIGLSIAISWAKEAHHSAPSVAGIVVVGRLYAGRRMLRPG